MIDLPNEDAVPELDVAEFPITTPLNGQILTGSEISCFVFKAFSKETLNREYLILVRLLVSQATASEPGERVRQGLPGN